MKEVLINKSSGLYFVVVFVLLINVISVNGCYKSGWDFLSDDWLKDLCPCLSKVGDLFETETIEYEGPITEELVTESLKCGRDISRAASKRGNKLVKSGANLNNVPRAMRHFFSPNVSPGDRKNAEVSHELLTATKILQMRVCSSKEVTPNTFLSFLEHQVIRVKNKDCRPPTIKCSNSKYRSIDGSCNNKVHKTWGRAGSALTRIAPPNYSDGIYAMPLAKSGRPLPNPRLLSTRLFYDRPVSSRILSYMNMQWGQLVTHDLLFRVMETTEEGGIQCCSADGKEVLSQEWLNDKCIPICVSDDDPFYRQYGVRCLNFVRSVTTAREDCSLGPAEQMNSVSSYLDGSVLYGSNKKLAIKIRSKKGGRLKEEKRNDSKRGFLPSVDDKLAACDLRNISEPCYLAGDARVNQTPTLALLHTLLLREHNRVADTLSSLNPGWDDERIYQEARRIVIAEIQHITYQEWLPLNFGENYLRYHRISPTSLYSRDYSPDVNAGAINAFGAGAFRFLHSMITEDIMSCPKNYQHAFLYKLSDHYFNPALLEVTPDSFDDLVRGILTQNAAESDPHCSRQISNLLFKSNSKWGMDLISMDIQRGRDHGLASYNTYREVCGLHKARSFQDLAGEISQDRINALQRLYESVDDIDLFVGGSMENAVQGSILGHTFQCIIAEQFYRSRVGDSFFYDHGEMPHSFTPDQLKELKKCSMARLICDNTDVYYVQKRAFELESISNPKVGCEDFNSLPYMDLTAWRTHTFEL